MADVSSSLSGSLYDEIPANLLVIVIITTLSPEVKVNEDKSDDISAFEPSVTVVGSILALAS